MKSESVWKILVIAVALLIVASVVVAVAITSNGDASSALNCKNPKLSTEVADNIPPPGIAPPAKSMIVNIYLTENKTEYIEELRNYVIDILYIKGAKVVAEIYTGQILEIANLPFVTYIEKTLMDLPLIYEPPPEEGVGSLSIDTYKDPKLSTKVLDNIPPPGIAPPAEPMTMNIYLTENKAEYIDELENHVIEILYIKGTKVVVEIYTDKILEIRNLPFVTYVETTLMDIQLPVFPEARSDENISEGVKYLDADTLHNRNSTGKGIKVAIIDDGFFNYRGCLPEENIKEVKSYGLASDTSSHGTACAEIVLQVAPDAELYLINCGEAGMLDQVVETLTAWNVDIVTRSLAQCSGLFDGTDEVCRVIDDAVFTRGIVWVNAAGNSATAHWEGTFNDSDGDGWHEFSREGGELGQTIYVNPGRDREGVTLSLSWNGSWNNETQDYDIYILDVSRKAVARSIDPQMGLNGHKSFEKIVWIPASKGTYNIMIRNCNTTKPVHFDLYLWPWGTTPSCNVENSSLCADACAFGVIAAGAVNQRGELEVYSSRGPTNDGRIKPNFVAPVGYDTCAYSGPFFGTSASSPHIAGEIALLLSWIRETQPEQNGTAYDLIKPYLDGIANTTEPDNEYGYGPFPECYNSS